MDIRQDFPAIVYFVDVFRHSPDIITTFLELSPADQDKLIYLLGALAYGLWRLWKKFRSQK